MGLKGFVFIFAVGLVALFVGSVRLDFKPAPFGGLQGTLNDQFNYISVAKNLIFNGSFESNSILPSVLSQDVKTNILYVPGPFYVLALCFYFFGLNFFSLILPSAAGYILILISVYFICLKLFNLKIGIIASFVVAIFPYFLFYSLTSMIEMEVVSSTLISFLLVLYCPKNCRLLVAPLLAMLPVCFRETSIVVIFPMASVIWRDSSGSKKIRDTVIFLILSIIFFILIIKGPLGGRPSLLKANLFGGFSEIYSDANFNLQFKPSITQWVTAIIKKFFGNCVAMIQDNPFTTEALTLKFIGIASLSVLFKGWRKKSPFEVGVGGMGIIIFLFILGLYSVTAYRGLRISYILVPFLVIVLSSWVNNFNLKKSYLGLILAGVALVVIKQGFFDPTADFANIRLREKEDVIFVESLKPNKNKVFVGPFWLVLPWVYENYPVHWAFMPQNEHTFKLLDARDSVGTVLLYEHDAKIHEKTLIKVGYKKIKEAKFRSNRFFQYERSNVAN